MTVASNQLGFETPETQNTKAPQGATPEWVDAETGLSAHTGSANDSADGKGNQASGNDGQSDEHVFSQSRLPNFKAFAAHTAKHAPGDKSHDNSTHTPAKANAAVMAAANTLLNDAETLDGAFKNYADYEHGRKDCQISWEDIQCRIQSLKPQSDLRKQLEKIDRAAYDTLRGDERYIQVDHLRALVPVPTKPTHNMPGITEDQINTKGQQVSSLLANSKIHNNSSYTGIAITNLKSGQGKWQYRRDDGKSWHDVGKVSDQQALLLAKNDRLRDFS